MSDEIPNITFISNLILSACENVRHKVGISAKPFATDGKFEDSTKFNYSIIFGKVRNKNEEDDD